MTRGRRRLFLLEPTDLTVQLDAPPARVGRHFFEVTPRDVLAPPGVTVTAVEPGRLILDVEPAPTPAPPVQTP